MVNKLFLCMLVLKEGANIIQLGEDMDVVIKDWKKSLPVGLELKRLSSLDTYIDV